MQSARVFGNGLSASKPGLRNARSAAHASPGTHLSETHCGLSRPRAWLWRARTSRYNRYRALHCRGPAWTFLNATQAETLKKLADDYGTDARNEVFHTLRQELEFTPLWMIMRHGLKVRGLEFRLYYPKQRSAEKCSKPGLCTESHHLPTAFLLRRDKQGNRRQARYGP